jgi:TrmH family RNA methyltransferase
MSGLSNKELKFLASLQQKKYRKEHNQVLIEGLRLCEEALASDWTLRELFITPEFAERYANSRLFGLAGEKHLIPHQITENEFQRISDTRHGQGVALLADIPAQPEFQADPEWQRHLLIFDAISDPGNLGTILRSSDWFGVSDIVLSKNSVEWTNPKVIRSSMGAIFRTRIYEQELPGFLPKIADAGYNVLAAEIEGIPLSELPDELSNAAWGLLVGSEAHGISPQLEKYVHTKITIPGEGPADSLNVSTATSIILYELMN